MAGLQWLPYIDQDFAREFEHEFRVIETFLQNSTNDLWRHYQQCIAPRGSDPWDTKPQGRLVLALFAGLRACRGRNGVDHRVLREAAGVLLRRKLPLTPDDAAFLLDVALEHPSLAPEQFPVAGVLSAVELAVARQPLSPELRDRLQSVRQLLSADESSPAKMRDKLIAKIERLCNDSVAARLQADDGWADAVCETIRRMAPEHRGAWEKLLLHAAAVVPARPPADWSVSMKDMEHLVLQDPDRWAEVHDSRVLSKQPAAQWSAAAEQYITAVGRSAFTSQMIRWLERLPRSRPGYLIRESLNREMLRGLLWFSTGIGESAFVQALRIAGEFLYRKNSPLGTTVVQVLYRIPDRTAITELALMRGRVKPKARERLVALALRERASEAQIPPDDVEDLALPTLGMTEVGVRRQELQGYTAELAVAKAGRVELRWINPDGRRMKSVPAKVAASHPGEVRELKLAAKELRAALQTLASRVENAWMDQRRWTFSIWRERFLDHPVAGVLSRCLVWSFHEGERTVAGAWHEGQLVDLEGRALRPAPGAQVTLWHPAEAAVVEVAGWREWLYCCEVTQPFKQAHREIYLLTDAERATGTYSNRFAAHILRQPSFRALAKGRGWEAPYCGPWDSGGGGAARRSLESWGLQAEWWIDGAGDGHAPAGGYAYVATDQVRFCRTGESQPLPLTDVPPLVFSEVMRDIDLFVGVASVGNDPNWSDGGPEGRYRDYWQSYSFGDLSATGQTRKEVLQRLVPRLKFAERCSFSEKFLVVRGEIRTYKIHLGSGNILMSPNDQYLCIVPARGATAKGSDGLFLPFEGDATLSLILSKALLLAEDQKITDPTIASQIRQG